MYSGEIRDWPRQVSFGPGKVNELGRIVAALGAQRVLVVCGKSVAQGAMLARVRAGLGPLCVGVFGDAHAHSPFADVQAASAQARELAADCLVSVGGGSAIDTAKGVVLHETTAGDFAPYAIDYARKGMARKPLPAAALLHVAVPTTAGSSSDVLPTAGIRDPARPVKMLFWDERLVPDGTVLDPEMAVFAGARLSAATGMTAVARAIESLYSAHRHPISMGLALHAARLLRDALPRSVNAPDDLEARADCQMACLMSGTASINAMVSIVHAVGHVVGGRYGLQHGISHGILLAPALRRLLPTLGRDAAYVLEGLGCTAGSSGSAADTAAEAIRGLLAQLPLPQRLREAGIGADDLPGIAAGTMGDYMMANLPAPLTEADVLALLREAW